MEFFIEVGQPYNSYKDSAGNSKNRMKIVVQN
jgi:hypothetical protein